MYFHDARNLPNGVPSGLLFSPQRGAQPTQGVKSPWTGVCPGSYLNRHVWVHRLLTQGVYQWLIINDELLVIAL